MVTKKQRKNHRFLSLIVLQILVLLLTQGLSTADAFENSEELYQQASYYFFNNMPYDALTLYSEGLKLYPGDFRFEKGIIKCQFKIMGWSLGSHRKQHYSAAIKGYTAITGSPNLDAYINSMASRNKARALNMQVAYERADYVDQGMVLLNKSLPYQAFNLFSEGYSYYKDKELSDGVVQSGKVIVSWSMGSHRKGNFGAAINGYNTVIGNPFIPTQLKEEANRFLTFAKEYKMLLNADDYLTKVSSMANPYQALTLLQEAIYLYPEDSRIKDAIDLKIRTILSWSFGSHSKKNYSAAINGYSTVINSIGVNSYLKNLAERNVRLAEQGKPYYTSSAYLVNGTRLLDSSQPYQALELFEEGYAYYKQDEILRGIQSSANTVLKWSIGSHNSGNYGAALKGYETVVNSPNVENYLIFIAETNQERAQNNRTVYGSQDFAREGYILLSSNQPYTALKAFTDSYSFFKTEELYKGLVESSEKILSWSKGSHKGGHFNSALKGYNTVIQNEYVPLYIKSSARQLILLAERRIVLTDQKLIDLKRDIVNTSKSIYTYEEMLSDIKELEYLYKEAITIESIGKSILQKDLWAITLGNPNAPKKILVHGSMHAREHMTTTLIMKQLEYYLQNYDKGTYSSKKYKDILDKVAITYVPMVNPDGVTLSQKGLPAFSDPTLRAKLLKLNGGSSNFSRWKANIRGVDLNRNYNANWDKVVSSTVPGPLNYKGPSVESEPETKAMVNYTMRQKFVSTISYHSTGSIIYWYYFQEGSLLKRDKALSDKLSEMTGYEPVTADPNLRSHAGYSDWYTLQHGTANFTIEIGRGQTPLKASEFPDIWKRNRLTSMFIAFKNQ